MNIDDIIINLEKCTRLWRRSKQTWSTDTHRTFKLIT